MNDEITIHELCEISDDEAEAKIEQYTKLRNGRTSIAELAEMLYLPFDQIERVVQQLSPEFHIQKKQRSKKRSFVEDVYSKTNQYIVADYKDIRQNPIQHVQS